MREMDKLSSQKYNLEENCLLHLQNQLSDEKASGQLSKALRVGKEKLRELVL